LYFYFAFSTFVLIFKRKKFEKNRLSGGFVGFVLFSGSAGVKKPA